MKRIALALAALAVIGVAASVATAGEGVFRYAVANGAGPAAVYQEVHHPGPWHHRYYGPRHWGPPVVVRPRVVVPAPVIVAPPVARSYYAPSAGFQYYGRNYSIGIGF